MIQIPFQQITEALLNQDKPFPPRYLHRLTDLPPQEAGALNDIWERIPDWRRRALLEDLMELGESDYVVSFEAVARIALQDGDAQVRKLAILLLNDYELPDLIAPLIKMVEHDPDADVRAASASALGAYVYLGELEELPATKLHWVEQCLLRVTSGSDTQLVRRRALEALGYSSRPEVPPLIEAAYQSKNKDWLITALFAMGHSANEQWANPVMRMLESSNATVRAEAATAAGAIGLKDAIPDLLGMLKDDDDDARAAAIWSLSEIGGPGVQQALEELLEQAEDEDDEEFISEALENLEFNEEMELFSMINLTEADLDPSENLVDIPATDLSTDLIDEDAPAPKRRRKGRASS